MNGGHHDEKVKGAWRGPAALALALVYALAVEDLMNWLGPVRFFFANAGVAAVLWLLGTAPHFVRYAAPPPAPVDDDERVTIWEVMWIVAAAIVLAAVLIAAVPSLIF